MGVRVCGRELRVENVCDQGNRSVGRREKCWEGNIGGGAKAEPALVERECGLAPARVVEADVRALRRVASKEDKARSSAKHGEQRRM